VLRGGDEVVLAEGQTVQVMVDLATGRPRPIGARAQAWLRAQA